MTYQVRDCFVPRNGRNSQGLVTMPQSGYDKRGKRISHDGKFL
jgi:hypothetical protein